MTELSNKIKNHICSKVNSTLSRDRAWKTPQIIYSGHEVPGEGEHKIMDMLRSLKGHAASDKMTHCILGDDADLDLLGLALGMPNILVASNIDGSLLRYEGIFIDALAECIRKDLGPQQDKERIVCDFVMLLTLCGNDFLPPIRGFAIEHGNFDKLMQTYAVYIENGGAFLTEQACINLSSFQKFLKLYPATPSDKVTGIVSSQINGLLKNGGTITLKGDKYFQRGLIQQAHVSNKVSITPRISLVGKRKGLLDAEALQQGLSIQLFSQKSQETFGFSCKRFRPNLIGDANPIVQEYFHGLHWVLKYYLHGMPSWDWIYPHSRAPSLQGKLEASPLLIARSHRRSGRPIHFQPGCAPSALRVPAGHPPTHLR